MPGISLGTFRAHNAYDESLAEGAMEKCKEYEQLCLDVASKSVLVREALGVLEEIYRNQHTGAQSAGKLGGVDVDLISDYNYEELGGAAAGASSDSSPGNMGRDKPVDDQSGPEAASVEGTSEDTKDTGVFSAAGHLRNQWLS